MLVVKRLLLHLQFLEHVLLLVHLLALLLCCPGFGPGALLVRVEPGLVGDCLVFVLREDVEFGGTVGVLALRLFS